MKKLLLILIVCCSLSGFGQTIDSLKIYWTNGNLKYIHYTTFVRLTGSNDDLNDKVGMSIVEYYDTNGVQITTDDFELKFGSKFQDSISVYMQWRSVTKTDKSADSYNYERFIEKADVALYYKEYENALRFYKKALGIKPQEPYPKKQIKDLEYYLSND